MPVPMTKDQLIETLEVMIEHIRQGDSYEGNVQYLMPYDDESGEIIEGADFVVSAAYRVGNLQGQGGMRMIGELR